MALLIPEFLRVLPEKYLNTGPLLSSSHCKQSFKLPSGLLFGFPVIQSFMQIPKHSFLVLIELYNQISAQVSVNPIAKIQLRAHLFEITALKAHFLTGAVRFFSR